MRFDLSAIASAAPTAFVFLRRPRFAAWRSGLRAAAVATILSSGASAAFAVQYGNCHWDGTAPFCNGTCSDGFVQVKTKSCVTGHKAYCCEVLGSTTSDGPGQAFTPAPLYYVAVAGDEKGRWTLSAGYPNKQSATAAALNECGSGCKLLHERQARCVAVSAAAEGTPWGIASENDIGRAQLRAQRTCAAVGTGHCNAVQAKCAGS